MSLADELINLGAQLAAENDAAYDLWTWLPSCKTAQKHHGSYTAEHAEHRPSNRDVMHESAMYLAYLVRADGVMTAEEQEWLARCPCGEPHPE